jgi:hypothetical protein
MISRGDPPRFIENQIVYNPNLEMEDKKSLLAELGQDLSATESEGKKVGLDLIYGLIVPKRGELALFKETRLETLAVSRAQQMFKDWIDQQKSLGKTFTVSQARAEAERIGLTNVVPAKEQMRYFQERSRELKEEMRQFKEEQEARKKE